MSVLSELTQLKHTVERAAHAFAHGSPVLIGDDGKRENEVDFVFHALFSSPELVNWAITHAKGLLCVSVDQAVADALGLHAAPTFPSGISHTNFTLSVDAKNGITSGISAKDRAHTIQLLARPESRPTDFLTPGHVFPVIAVEGGLFSRAGHTEAIAELCAICQLPGVGAMCEVLDEQGSSLPPQGISQLPAFQGVPFLTTVDLLWYKVFYGNQNPSSFPLTEQSPGVYSHLVGSDFVSLDCQIQFYTGRAQDPCRVVLCDGSSIRDNGVDASQCCAEIVVFGPPQMAQNLPACLTDFCDLSARIGLKGTQAPVKRLVTLWRALSFVAERVTGQPMSAAWASLQKLPASEDHSLIEHVLHGRHRQAGFP